MYMKIVSLCLVAIFVTLDAVSPPSPCSCWDGWERDQHAQGWSCKEKSSGQIFACDIDKPPTCVCKEKGTGRAVNMPFPAINCVQTDNPTRFQKNECETNSEWEAWFSKYPNYRIYY